MIHSPRHQYHVTELTIDGPPKAPEKLSFAHFDVQFFCLSKSTALLVPTDPARAIRGVIPFDRISTTIKTPARVTRIVYTITARTGRSRSLLIQDFIHEFVPPIWLADSKFFRRDGKPLFEEADLEDLLLNKAFRGMTGLQFAE